MKHHMLQLRLLKHNNAIEARKFGSGQPNQNYLIAFELYLAFVHFLILKQENNYGMSIVIVLVAHLEMLICMYLLVVL